MGEFPNKATQFKPGQSGNPLGGRVLGPEAQGLPKFDRHTFARIVWNTWNQSVEDLRRVATNPQSKAHEAWLAAAALKGIVSGDVKRLDWFCTRLGLPALVQYLDVNIQNEILGVDESMKQRMIRMVMNSKLMQDPDVRKQIIDVKPETEKNQKAE